MNIFLPDWLAGKALDPGAGAYERLDPALRAHLKTLIATLHESWLPERHPGGSFRRLPGGVAVLEQSSPLDWALFVQAKDYASPAGLTAALLPALLAGVEVLAVCRLGDPQTPLHPGLSAALELLGREEIFALSPEEAGRLAGDLEEQSRFGRVLALGGRLRGAHALPGRVRIGLEGAEPERAVLDWLHPAAEVGPVEPGAYYDAVISAAPDFTGDYPAPLVLGADQAYLWRWPEIGPAFFRRNGCFITPDLR